MKTKKLVTMMVLVAVVLAVMALKADVVRPSYYALTYPEWKNALSQKTPNPWLWGASLSIPGIAILFFWGCRKKLALKMAVALCLPLFLLLPWNNSFSQLTILVTIIVCSFDVMFSLGRKEKFVTALIFFLGVVLLSLVCAVYPTQDEIKRNFQVALGNCPIEPRIEETYEEYQKRARREYFHYCPNCDIHMKETNLSYIPWYSCDRCGYGKKEIEEEQRRLSDRSQQLGNKFLK